MASKKPKYNPDDVERWVTVRGARIPIMKDGSFGIGTVDDPYKDVSEYQTLKKLNIPTDYFDLGEYTVGIPIRLSSDRELNASLNKLVKEHGWTNDGIIDDDDFGEGKMTWYSAPRIVPKTTSKNAKYDTSRAKKNKPPIEDRFSFQVAMPHPNASNDSQMKATTKLAVSQITKQFEDSGIKLSKVGAFDGSQFFIPDKGSYVVELSRTSRGDSKNQVSFNTRIWDNSTATGKNLIKRFKNKK